jgi:hypothetical protein
MRTTAYALVERSFLPKKYCLWFSEKAKRTTQNYPMWSDNNSIMTHPSLCGIENHAQIHRLAHPL